MIEMDSGNAKKNPVHAGFLIMISLRSRFTLSCFAAAFRNEEFYIFSPGFAFSLSSLRAIASLSSLARLSLRREYSSLRLVTAFMFSSLTSGNRSCDVISVCMAQRYNKRPPDLHLHPCLLMNGRWSGR